MANKYDELNCSFKPAEKYTPPDLCIGTMDLSTSECAKKEAQYMEQLQAEALEIAAGPVNVFPLLGYYNQGSTVNEIGNGFPLSSGTAPGYNIVDAFNSNPASWRTIQSGSAVVTAPAYIGYDFGTLKAWEEVGPPQERYFPSEPVRKTIKTIKIKQGAAQINRAAQVKIEASDDGATWKRIDVVNLANSDQLITVGVNSSAPYRMWRVVPTMFYGGLTEAWEIVELQMLEDNQLSLDAVEDLVLGENRDRAYSKCSVMIKCQYDLIDVQTELAKFGINLPQTYIFTCSFAMMVKALGRPVIVGDILELPGEIQYDHQLRPVRKWLEVTDTAWSTEGYTFDWKPKLFKFYAQPVMPSAETRDILGVPGKVNQEQTDGDALLNGTIQNDQAYKAAEAIVQEAQVNAPQTGGDPANIQSGRSMLGPPGTYDGNDLYVEDAIPPNGVPYTYGDTLPTGVSDGHYHRQTYTSVQAAIRPPDRLLRWNAETSRWIVIEINSRERQQSHKKTIAKILSSQTAITPDSKL